MEVGDLLIDTSIIIEYLRKKNKRKTQFYKIAGRYTIYISTITLFELFAGAKNEQKKQDIENIIDYLEILPFTKETAKKSAEIYLSLKLENQIIEAKDIFIAATALIHELPIITLNIKHFDRIAELNMLQISQ